MRGKVIVVEEKDSSGQSHLQFLTSYDDYVMDEAMGAQIKAFSRPIHAMESTLNVTNVTLLTSTNDSTLGESIPNGYSLPHIIITTILVSVIMFVIVFGNLLVIIAIFTDKTLKTVQNWFIACLAVADALLGLVVMPFSLANEMMGYWYFGALWCDLWKVIDVLLCTASILSICLISLDRYWSITRAVTYSRQRTPRRAAMMIAAVWFLSAVICVPPLIGWKNPLPVSEYPLCILSDDIGYVFYSTMGSFYIPCVIMVFVYLKIYIAAKNLARKNIRKKENSLKSGQDVKDAVSVAITSSSTNGDCRNDDLNSETSSDRNMSPLKDKQFSDFPTKFPTKPCNLNNVAERDMESIHLQNIKTTNEADINKDANVENGDNEQTISNDKIINDIRSDNKLKENSPKNGKKDTVKNKSIKKLGMKKSKSSSNRGNKGGWRTASVREHERQRRRLAKARERRATIVLGLVMAAFILCWFPFFTLYIIKSLCDCIGDVVFTVVFWAGYCNSALNPIIYTVFNRDFRHAFHRIICTQWICR